MTMTAEEAERHICEIAHESLISDGVATALMVNILHDVMHQAARRGDEIAQRCAGAHPTETLLNVTEWFDVAGDDGDGVFL